MPWRWVKKAYKKARWASPAYRFYQQNRYMGKAWGYGLRKTGATRAQNWASRRTRGGIYRVQRTAYSAYRRRFPRPGVPKFGWGQWAPAKRGYWQHSAAYRASRWIGRQVDRAGRFYYNTPRSQPWRYRRGRGHTSRSAYYRARPQARFRMRE